MLTATKTVRFDAAHMLANHDGQCKNLHGHTYRVDVEVARTDESRDMVIDFKDLKKIVEETVLSRFDHSFIYNNASEAECEIAAVLRRHSMRTVELPFRSTAENLAAYFFGELKKNVPGLCAVKVFETPDSCAEYRERT